MGAGDEAGSGAAGQVAAQVAPAGAVLKLRHAKKWTLGKILAGVRRSESGEIL